MLALVGVGAVPLASFASTNIRLQSTITDGHAAMGHYGFMAAFSYTVLGTGVLASLRPPGWRLAAWVTGLLPALLGLTSLVYTDISSRLEQGWALAAIAWGAAFIAAALPPFLKRSWRLWRAHLRGPYYRQKSRYGFPAMGPRWVTQ